MTEAALRGLELRSLVTSDGKFELSLQTVEIGEPGPDQVVVRIEAAPIHPSDMALLLGPVDLDSLKAGGRADRPVTSGVMLEERRAQMTPRFGLSLPVGNEGAGVVVKAGTNGQALVGRTVALAGGGTYAQYRLADAASCVVVPDGTKPSEAGAALVNPMTALSLVETMRMEGYRGLVHTAAASTLGQMLVRICIADEIPLVNIVRSPAQVAILRDIGAEHVLDSSSPDFLAQLTDAIAKTEALVAFDATGGGALAGQILAAMESALTRKITAYSRYGSTAHKQVYVYGGLDSRPTTFDRGAIGMYWGISAFMLGPFLEKVGTEGRKRLQARLVAELKTTFATHYAAEISLAEALAPHNLQAVARRATGEKYLINPSKGV